MFCVAQTAATRNSRTHGAPQQPATSLSGATPVKTATLASLGQPELVTVPQKGREIQILDHVRPTSEGCPRRATPAARLARGSTEPPLRTHYSPTSARELLQGHCHLISFLHTVLCLPGNQPATPFCWVHTPSWPSLSFLTNYEW